MTVNPSLEFTTSISYLDYEFDNQTENSAVQDSQEQRARDGYSYRLSLEQSLAPFGASDVLIYLNLRKDDYDNSDPNFEYDREIVELGLQLSTD